MRKRHVEQRRKAAPAFRVAGGAAGERDPAGLPIGIFDSGIGGLTVVRRIHELLPQEDLVYLGDTARVPYGTKAPSTVIRFAIEDTGFLVRRGVKAVVAACNTVSAWALPALRERFDLPLFGVIEPGAEMALARTRSARVGVIGTAATIQSRAYVRVIQERRPEVRVFGRACPLLVPLVEEGWTQHSVTLAVLHEYLEPLLRKDVDTLVLGCTHYPLLKRAIRRVASPQVALIDSAQSCAEFVRGRLGALGLVRSDRRRGGTIRAFVTDETDRFDALARRFFGWPLAASERVELTSS